MKNQIARELLIPKRIDVVWEAIANRDSLTEWMYPNDFEPRIGHKFTFQVPPKPEVGFDGMVVHCEVLECEPPNRLVFSWSAGGPVVNTRVSFRLEAVGVHTRLNFEHSGFDLEHPWGSKAIGGAEHGWSKMLNQMKSVIDKISVADA